MKFFDLVLEPADINEEAAAKLVAPFIKYTPEGELIFTERFKKLRDMDKVVRYLIGRLGLVFIRGEGTEIGVTSKDIANKLRISYSSVRVYITRLKRKGWVVTGPKDKKHKITNQAIIDLSSKKGKKNE